MIQHFIIKLCNIKYREQHGNILVDLFSVDTELVVYMLASDLHKLKLDFETVLSKFKWLSQKPLHQY